MAGERYAKMEAMRATAQQCLLGLLYLQTPLIGAIAWSLGAGAAETGGLAAAMTVLATLGAGAPPHRRRQTSSASRALVALAAVAQVALIVAALSGSAWQIDAHMYFFATIGMLIALVDAPALLLAAGAVAVHHLALNFLAAELVYPGGADFARTMLHAVILIVMTAASALLIQRVQRLFAASDDASAEAKASADRAEAALEAAKRAEAEAAAERRKLGDELKEQVGAVVEAARRGQFDRRVERRFDDEALQALANQVNALVATIDQGFSAANQALGALSKGDLTARMDGAFEGGFAELQRGLNDTSSRLAELVGKIQSTARTVQASAKQIRADAETLSAQAEGQASSLEETAATMEEMTATIRANAENAQKATGVAGEAETRARRGRDIVGQAVSAMGEIEASSAKISDIISVIDGIAFQTNLLALNAAVEAARAGEAGKGFAVVASEVRTLSQRSSEAAQDIKTLILESSDKVSGGAKLVNSAGEALDEILQSVQEAAATIDEISSASREQSSGVAEISSAVSSMDEATQRNAALADQSASTARELSDDAQTLGDFASAFDTGSGAAPSREATADAAWTKAEAARSAAPAHAPAKAAANESWAEF